MLGAKTSLGSQRCNASNGEALLKTATELIGIIQVKRKEIGTAIPCRSEPARDSGVSVDIHVECQSAIASKPAPTQGHAASGITGRL